MQPKPDVRAVVKLVTSTTTRTDLARQITNATEVESVQKPTNYIVPDKFLFEPGCAMKLANA